VNQAASKSQNARERSPSTSSSDEDEAQTEPEENVTSGPPATQYDTIRDNNFRHLQNPERDDAIAEKAFTRRRGRIGRNVGFWRAINIPLPVSGVVALGICLGQIEQSLTPALPRLPLRTLS